MIIVKYRISSIKRPGALISFETLKEGRLFEGGAYSRGGRLLLVQNIQNQSRIRKSFFKKNTRE